MRAFVLERLTGAGLAVGEAQADKLAAYLALLERWNRVHNLTAITTAEAMIDRLLAESLALRGLLRGRRIADVGSGAGFPGIPLAIVETDRSFTLIESRAKRASFLQHVRGELVLEHVSVVHSRVEDLRDTAPFDTVLARAVAALPELVDLAAHLLGDGGVMLVPTKAGVDASSVDEKFEVRRIEADPRGAVKGALFAIERGAR